MTATISAHDVRRILNARRRPGGFVHDPVTGPVTDRPQWPSHPRFVASRRQADLRVQRDSAYAPADGDWWGCAHWLCDRRAAIRSPLSAPARRLARVNADPMIDELVGRAQAAVDARQAQPVTFTLPQEWEHRVNGQSRWLRDVQRVDGETFLGAVRVDAHQFAHVEACLPPCRWLVADVRDSYVVLAAVEGRVVAVLSAPMLLGAEQSWARVEG